MIAGTHSSAGKTTWSLAISGFFRKRGYKVQPFKVGPDYIDPGFQNQACAPRKARNLDRFFLSEEYLKRCFEKHSSGADLALVEGVMGLYDGRTTVSEEGSTAQMAKLLGLPVFLVVDGSGLARSAAAVVKGYRDFDKDLNLAGIFLNRIGSEGHLRWLREPIEKETGIPVLGWLPSEPAVSIPERHLGLRTAMEEETVQTKLDQLAHLLNGRFEFEKFLELSHSQKEPISHIPSASDGHRMASCQIGVAYDRAFSFYYEDNFDLLREAGSKLVFFSPLSDTSLPSDLDALYLGGGFPELYANELSENKSMISSIRRFYEEGGLLYAECGGLIYLTQSLVGPEEKEIPLAGLIPGKVRMTNRLQHFGYHEIQTMGDTFLFPAGRKLRSHEFHYSIWDGNPENAGPYQIGQRPDGFYNQKILASYQHLHFGQDPELAKNFVRSIKATKSLPAGRHGGIG